MRMLQHMAQDETTLQRCIQTTTGQNEDLQYRRLLPLWRYQQGCHGASVEGAEAK